MRTLDRPLPVVRRLLHAVVVFAEDWSRMLSPFTPVDDGRTGRAGRTVPEEIDPPRWHIELARRVR